MKICFKSNRNRTIIKFMNIVKKQAILKDAKENWDNDLTKAAAAHLYGANVVRRCGGNVPPFADTDAVAALEKELSAKPEPPKKTK